MRGDLGIVARGCNVSIFQISLPPRGRGRFLLSAANKNQPYIQIRTREGAGARRGLSGAPEKRTIRKKKSLAAEGRRNEQKPARPKIPRRAPGPDRANTNQRYIQTRARPKSKKAPPAPGRQCVLKYRLFANGQQSPACSPRAAKIHPAPHNFTAPDATTPDNAHNFPLPMSAAAAHNFPRVDVRRC